MTDHLSSGRASQRWKVGSVALAVLLPGVTIGPLAWAPTEASMGDVQKVLYIHVPVAWVSLLAFLVMAVCSVTCVMRRNLMWDEAAGAACELGWIAGGLTLATGSLWAAAAWGTAWTWDPRLTSAFVLWMIYGGGLVVRKACADKWQRAKLTVVVACLGAVNVPIVVMATRWFRGIHPVAPDMDPMMRVTLYLNVGFVMVIFGVLFWMRAAARWSVPAFGDYEHQENKCADSGLRGVAPTKVTIE